MSSPTSPNTTNQQFPTSPETVDNALLLASLSSLGTPQFLGPAITSAATSTRSKLVIVLFSRLFNRAPGEADDNHSRLDFPSSRGISHTEQWDDVQRLLTFVYVQAFKTAQQKDKVLMDIDVLLRGLDENVPEELGRNTDIVFRVSGDSIAVPLPPTISDKRYVYLPAGDRLHENSRELRSETKQEMPSFYPVLALGGTFDHLHPGHKILLSMGAWITSRKIIVGVTDDEMLQKKANKDVMEKLPVRMERVRTFLRFFKPSLEFEIVPLNDVYGPTGWDPDIQALVVSKETLEGARSVAAHRASHSLPPLRQFVIDVISSTSSCLDHADAEWLKNNKLSSTYIREWIVEKERGKE
ncbi:Nucleotidylyl transferase [Amanita muscaria]